MNLKEAKGVAGTLSNTSKMPGYSYGLPAIASCPVGSKLANIDGTICSKCYARKGFYVFGSVKTAQYYRLASAIGNPNWVEAMTLLVNHYCKKVPYFRWHDSGDIIDFDHLERIANVCTNTRKIKHWLPTREYATVKSFYKTKPIPRNLTIRLSANRIGNAATRINNLTTSAVHTDSIPAPEGYKICSAYANDGKCGDCRDCWKKSVKHVSYHYH